MLINILRLGRALLCLIAHFIYFFYSVNNFKSGNSLSLFFLSRQILKNLDLAFFVWSPSFPLSCIFKLLHFCVSFFIHLICSIKGCDLITLFKKIGEVSGYVFISICALPLMFSYIICLARVCVCCYILLERLMYLSLSLFTFLCVARIGLRMHFYSD